MNFKLIKLLLGFIGFPFIVFAQQTIVVKDNTSKQPIEDAVIIYDNTYVETNNQGKAKLDLNIGEHLIEVKILGYITYKGKFRFSKDSNTLYLKADKVQLDDVIVHGKKKFHDKTAVVSVIKSKELSKNTSTSLGDILEQIEGVSSIKTGGTIVKPVVHGMYGNRIVILNNGVVQQGQDWSAEHATEIDPYIANEITVIKGAEGVKYGTGALGGVVLISPKKLSYHSERIKGGVTSVLASNGNATTTSAKLESSLLGNKFAWRVQGTKHVSADVKTADYFLNNTGTESLSFSGNMGYKTENLGLEAFYSKYTNNYGLAPVAEVGNEYDLFDRVKNGRPFQFFLVGYAIKSPKQAVTHHLGKINGFWKPLKKGEFKVQYSFQLNDRKEYFPRRAGLSEVPAFYTELITHNVLGSYQQKWNDVWNTEIGLSYQNQINKNIFGTKVDPTIPNFTNIGFGGYLIQKYTTTSFEIAAGIRYDFKTESALGIRRSSIYGSDRTFSNLVSSLSAIYNIDHLSITSNFGMASRAPHVSELYSAGLKHGGLFYLIGDSTLKTEKSLKWINNVTYHDDKWYVQFSSFVQKLNNYIYDAPSSDTKLLWSGPHYVSRYKQADAFFKGIDANFCYHFHKNFEYLIKGSLVHATNLETDGYFPFIPSENIVQQVKFNRETENNIFSDIYVGLEHRFVAKQKRFDISSELSINNKPIDTPKAYHLFNLTAGFTTAKFKNKQLSFHLSVDNLFDNLYKDYTNRYRYFAHDLGRNIQIKTIFNF